MSKLKEILLPKWILNNGNSEDISLSYQTFGPELGTAPIVLVNHALTGNSNVCGKNGWWKNLIGIDKAIDTLYFTVIAFNIPGNGFDDESENLIYNYRDFTTRDMASIFWKGLKMLDVKNLYAIIGGSLGGGIAWEMAALQPNAIKNLIPIATDWKATDWVIANVLVQDQILNNSDDPIADARLHAMLLYRTPQSLGQKFNRKQNDHYFQIESWLIHHGIILKDRFRLSAYKLMNHLLKTIDIGKNADAKAAIQSITANIHLVGINTDLFFIPEETRQTFADLKSVKSNIFYHEIRSIHGHDAFLIEYEQLAQIIQPIFNTLKQKCYVAN